MDFRAELDSYIDTTLASLIDGEIKEQEGRSISFDTTTILNSKPNRNMLGTETLLNELLGMTEVERISKMEVVEPLDPIVNRASHEGSTTKVPNTESPIDVGELEEGELVSEYAWLSESKRLVYDKSLDKMAIGKLVAANISMTSDHQSKWIYGRITGINADKVRVIAIPLIDGHPEWSMKEWTVIRDNLVFLPEMTDYHGISIHLARLRRAQLANETLMVVCIDVTDTVGHIFRPAHLCLPPEDQKITDPNLEVEIIETHQKHQVPLNQCMSL